jgi:hypothetical protein
LKTKIRFLHPFLLLCLIVLPGTLSHSTLGLSLANGQLLSYQSTGPNAPLYFQRINNTSFETGTQAWTEFTYNNYSSSVSFVSPGYNDNSAVQLLINSGNLTVDSHLTLTQDFSKSTIPFGSSMRFRAAVETGQLQGNSVTDRIEVSVTLTSSIGNQARVHYVFAHLPGLLVNTTGDAYFAIDWSGPTRWILIDRNLATDAISAFPSLNGNLDSVKDVRLAVYSTSLGVPTYDPRIKYYETGSDSYWNTTETVVFDPDADGFFNPATDWILYNRGVPLTSQMLSNDPRIKFVDTNFNGRWDPGEPIVYDLKNEGIYDLALNDPVINGTAVAGSLLQDPVRMQTSALFDQVELYSQTGNYDWIRNGGFETGDLTGWGNTAGFTVTSTQAHSGSYSTVGTATGTTIDLARSIDARPAIDSSARLQASAYVGGMTGASSSDKVDLWLGLVDSSPQANPLSVYYYFKTGTSSVPSNTTDTVNHKVSGFGSFGQWLSLNQSLLPDTGYFNLTGHTAPYRIETVVLEVSAQTSLTTSAYFDDLSIPTAYKPGPAVSNYYAVDGLNSTYSYIATKVPQGQFYLSVPSGQSLLNITSPAATALQLGDYSVQTLAGSLFITVLNPTAMTYPAFSTWRFYTTSQNALTYLYTTPTGSIISASKFDPGSSVTFASQTKDPMGNPIAGSNVTLIFYSSSNQVFTGVTNNQGWYNKTDVTLPQNSGSTTLEAITRSSSYIGLRTTQLTINSTFPWAIVAYSSVAVAGLAVLLLFLVLRRRKQVPPIAQYEPSRSKKMERKNGRGSE